MNVEYINPIIQTSKRILLEAANVNTKVGKVYTRQSPYSVSGIAAIIGITGSIRGQAMFSTTTRNARRIASAMFGIQTDVGDGELDDIGKSAFAEMANMIMGNYLGLLPKQNFLVDITPPTIIISDKVSCSQTKQTIICIPLLFDDEEVLEIHISFVEAG